MLLRPLVLTILGLVMLGSSGIAAPLGFTNRAAWVAGAGEEPDFFLFFDESASGPNSVAHGTSIDALATFYADSEIEFKPFVGTAVYPFVARNQQFQMINSLGADGGFPGRSRDALLANNNSPGTPRTPSNVAISWDFLEPMRGVGVRANNLDGGFLLAYGESGQLLFTQTLGDRTFAGILSDVPIHSVSVQNTFDSDLRFGIYDVQYHLFETVTVPEPSSLLLLSGALLVWHRIRRRG